MGAESLRARDWCYSASLHHCPAVSGLRPKSCTLETHGESPWAQTSGRTSKHFSCRKNTKRRKGSKEMGIVMKGQVSQLTLKMCWLKVLGNGVGSKRGLVPSFSSAKPPWHRVCMVLYSQTIPQNIIVSTIVQRRSST